MRVIISNKLDAKDTPILYRPRHPERTVLYRVLFHYFDRFLAEYESRFEREYGYFRPIIKEDVITRPERPWWRRSWAGATPASAPTARSGPRTSPNIFHDLLFVRKERPV